MAEVAKTNLNDKTIVNTKVIAKMFSMTERNVRYLVEEGIIARVNHGRYDLIDTVSRYITFLKMSNSELDEGKVQESLEYEKWLHEKAKREKAEIELSHLKKEMHKADEVEKVLNHMLMAFRSKMMSLPSKAALFLASKDDPMQNLENGIQTGRLIKGKSWIQSVTLVAVRLTTQQKCSEKYGC